MTLTATRLPSSSLSDLIEPLRTISAIVVSGGAVAHDRARREHHGVEPLLDRLERRDGVAEHDVEPARLQHRHRDRAAVELGDLDLEAFGLEVALLVGDHGAERFRERQAGRA